MRRIVCAAVRRKRDGAIICGPRHYDAVMRAQMNLPDAEWCNGDQGFVDQFGEFLSREAAYFIAEAAGQIIHQIGDDRRPGSASIPTLYSEHLY